MDGEALIRRDNSSQLGLAPFEIRSTSTAAGGQLPHETGVYILFQLLS